jgi:hypothetical protein
MLGNGKNGRAGPWSTSQKTKKETKESPDIPYRSEKKQPVFQDICKSPGRSCLPHLSHYKRFMCEYSVFWNESKGWSAGKLGRRD